ncbi:hypothetical protein [Neobacillus sp. BF23-41]|uniref:hypothetical protein n=1 Tax=Neobacillus sp. BF23-41 TaxID=3240280 RepID=UPI0034E3A59C
MRTKLRTNKKRDFFSLFHARLKTIIEIKTVMVEDVGTVTSSLPPTTIIIPDGWAFFNKTVFFTLFHVCI